MADWNNLDTDINYVDFVSDIVDRDEDVAKMFDGTSESNLPSGAKRWNAGANRFEKYNGTSWSALSSEYQIKVSNATDADNATNADHATSATSADTAALATIANNASALDGVGASSVAAGNTVVQRDASADIWCRLNRQTYSVLNPTPNYIMTQVGVGASGNNYVRPCSLSTLRSNLLAANTVTQSTLKSTTASQSLAVPALYGNIILTGASYTLSYYVGDNGTASRAGTNDVPYIVAHTGTYVNRVTVLVPNNHSFNMYVYSRYIQASPPYDYGKGDAPPLFVQILMNKNTKQVLGTTISQDPPWVTYGPTRTHADGYDGDGVPYKFKSILPEDAKERLALIKDPSQRFSIIKRLKQRKNLPRQKIVLTHEIKNADINIVPHLFDETVANNSENIAITLDPYCELMEDLNLLSEEDPEAVREIGEIIENGYIELDNSHSNIISPDKAKGHKGKWKRT